VLIPSKQTLEIIALVGGFPWLTLAIIYRKRRLIMFFIRKKPARLFQKDKYASCVAPPPWWCRNTSLWALLVGEDYYEKKRRELEQGIDFDPGIMCG